MHSLTRSLPRGQTRELRTGGTSSCAVAFQSRCVPNGAEQADEHERGPAPLEVDGAALSEPSQVGGPQRLGDHVEAQRVPLRAGVYRCHLGAQGLTVRQQ